MIPGSDDNGCVAVEALREWVTKARELAREADRLEVCDSTIGDVFARSREDTDGAKPPIAIREVIEEIESGDLEHGFHIGLRNLRGTFSKGLYEGGQQERDLAATFQKYSDVCASWRRTSATLRGVAENYLRDAQRADERAAARA